MLIKDETLKNQNSLEKLKILNPTLTFIIPRQELGLIDLFLKDKY